MDAIKAAKAHLAGTGAVTPFLVAFDAASDLRSLVEELASCTIIRMSDACPSPDAMPDIDALVEKLVKTRGKVLLLGVGEYAELVGGKEFVQRIYGFEGSGARIVAPLWKGHSFLAEATKNDPRVAGRRGAAFPETGLHWTANVYRKRLLAKPDANGFKALLRRLEDGYDGIVNAVTSVVPLDSNWCRKIDSPYQIYHARHPQSEVPESMFPEKEWIRFLDADRVKDENIASADGLLRVLEEGADNPYLALAASKTERLADWRRNLLTAILDVPADDERFQAFYAARKKLLGWATPEDIADYLRESRIVADPAVRLRYLTDATAAEREEIMALVAQAGTVPDVVKTVYPALWDYWRTFSFSSKGELDDMLSSYFRDYKRQKVAGCIEDRFSEMVRDLAEDRPQFVLPYREDILESIGSANAVLCWVDALGCEFLGFIQAAAERFGLKIKVTPARAKLPSITSVNRGFFDNWQGKKMQPVSRVDKIKHGDFERANPETPSNVAAELPHELAVLDETMRSIAATLRKNPGRKVVLTGDHGATRLAVLSGRETVWEMPEKGKHHGRCCRKSEFKGVLPPCVTESDNEEWHVLAGYDRFKGGRKGDVEVHGGATLEDMVVPVVELELLDRDLRVKLLEDRFRVTFRDSEITLTLFCSSPLSAPVLEIGGVRYSATASGEGSGRYAVRIPKPAAGEHPAAVFDGDTKVADVKFFVVSGGAQINTDIFG